MPSQPTRGRCHKIELRLLRSERKGENNKLESLIKAVEAKLRLAEQQKRAS